MQMPTRGKVTSKARDDGMGGEVKVMIGIAILGAKTPARRLQGCSKRWAPGCVKLGEKVVFCLPTAGRRTQLFHLIFTQPGAHLLEHPCTGVHFIVRSGFREYEEEKN